MNLIPFPRVRGPFTASAVVDHGLSASFPYAELCSSVRFKGGIFPENVNF